MKTLTLLRDVRPWTVTEGFPITPICVPCINTYSIQQGLLLIDRVPFPELPAYCLVFPFYIFILPIIPSTSLFSTSKHPTEGLVRQKLLSVYRNIFVS